MKRLLFVSTLALLACNRARPLAELEEQFAEIERLSHEVEALQAEIKPFKKRFDEARARGDQQEMARIKKEAQPILARIGPMGQPLLNKLEELKKKFLDKAETILTVHPDDVTALSLRIRFYEMQPPSQQEGPDPSLQKLLEDTERLLKLRPHDHDVLVARAGALRRAGRTTEARVLLDRIIEKDPTHARAVAESGLVAYSLDDFERSTRHLEQAAKESAKLPLAMRDEIEATLPVARERQALWQKELALRTRDQGADMPQVRLVTSKGEIDLELFEDDAPNTVANFIALADSKFYDGTRFHRVITHFMAQGGDPNSRDEDPKNDGQGGPGYTFKDELPEGTYRRHFRGSLSMANSGPDTNGSQFFITHRPTDHLDGKHTVFGRVIKGMEVVDTLAVGDTLKEILVLRRRDHSYRPVVER